MEFIQQFREERGISPTLDEIASNFGVTKITVYEHVNQLERKGALTALVTTEGFRDSLEIGQEDRYDQYDIFLEKKLPLIPRHLRLTVSERVDVEGAHVDRHCGRERDRVPCRGRRRWK